MDERQRIINNITGITDITDDNIGNKIEFPNGGIQIEFNNNKYSAKKLAVWNIYVNGKRISKSDDYIFEYTCVSCHSRQLLSAIALIRKVNKCAITCMECVRHPVSGQTPRALSYVEKRDVAVGKFDALDDDYKSAYFQNHLTPEEYLRISKNIVGFQNGKIPNFENIEYWPIYNSTTQWSFTHIMYNTRTQSVFKPHQSIMKCDNCNKHWRADTIEKFKNCHRIYCPQCCNTSNSVLHYHTTKNINNSQIVYCSQHELKFITWCNNNCILVNNGPIISYVFAGQTKTYRVGFLIGNTLIDIKDNIWQRDEQPSAMWQAKETATRSLIADGKYDEYIIITPRTWITNIKYLKNKSTRNTNQPEKHTNTQMIKQDIV